MSGTSSPFPAGSIRLPDNMVEMNRYSICVWLCVMFMHKYPQPSVPYKYICVCLCPSGPCWFRSDVYLCWRSLLGPSFSAFLLLSQCWGDPPGHTAQPHVWTSSSLSGNMAFSCLFLHRRCVLKWHRMTLNEYISHPRPFFSGGGHAGTSFPRGGRVGQGPSARKV